MNQNDSRSVLVKEAVVLLRQVRSGLNSELSRTLEPSLDEAIGKLEQCLHEGRRDPGWILDVLKVLAQGLAALPAIQRLIDMMKDE
jgi:hypothetical protein